MKFEIEIEETVIYRHTVIVEAECESDVDYALDCFEENADCKEDIYDYMNDNNAKVIGFCEDGSGEVEFECTDMAEIAESEVEQ